MNDVKTVRDESLHTAELRKVRFSLRLKLSIGLLLIIGIIFAGTNAYNVLHSAQARRTEALNSAETVARLVAGVLIGELGSNAIDSERVKKVVSDFLNAALVLNVKNKDLAYAVLVDANYDVIVGRAKPKLTVFPGGKTLADEAAVLAQVAALKGQLGGSMRFKRFPLKLGGEIAGTLIVGTSLARLERQMQQDLVLNVVVGVVTLLLLFIYSALMLSRFVVKPLQAVVGAMNKVQGGNLEHVLDVNSTDEIGVLAHSYNFMVSGLREREHLQDAFNRYVSDKVYAKFKDSEVALTGESRNATILFSDIRSFTSVSEKLSAEEVVAMLNEYFTEMVEIVFKYDGYLNKFIGDAIMAVYNVPVDQDSPELRAVYTAWEMGESLDILNARRRDRGQFPVNIGIGVNTGNVVAGNIGHAKRLEYTVIGDSVNLASRIESQTKLAGARILISEYTYAAVKDYVIVEELPPIKVKGKAEPVVLYKLNGLTPNAPRLT